jgi:hypothetical protein
MGLGMGVSHEIDQGNGAGRVGYQDKTDSSTRREKLALQIHYSGCNHAINGK